MSRTSQPSNWKSINNTQRSRYKAKVKAIIDNAKMVGCYFCRENDPIVLQFHHVDPASKSFHVGHSHTSRGIAAVEAEIAKCVVVCSNCHLRIHAGVLEIDGVKL
jgi:hypothetical protein